MIYSQFFLFIRYWKNSRCGAAYFFVGLPVCKKIVVLIIRFQEKLIQTLIPLAMLKISPPPCLVLLVREQFFFQLACISSKKSPPISRVNKHQYNNNKRVRRESSFLEIVRGEGIRSAQLGKSSLLRNRACWIHPHEFRCTKSGEWLHEERQSGPPCHVSSDDVWRVAV